MQRTDGEGLIISCDFCGTDWDPYDETQSRPMVEGHHGSVICLECVKLALAELAAHPGEYRCTLCIRDGIAADVPRWNRADSVTSPGLNPDALGCRDCIHQAAGKFSKDPDVKWKWERV